MYNIFLKFGKLHHWKEDIVKSEFILLSLWSKRLLSFMVFLTIFHELCEAAKF